MKPILIFVIISLLLGMKVPFYAQNYDEALADSLGADDYGMKSYVLVILKTGPAKIENKTIRDSLFRGHINNINKLAKEGSLVVAGPLNKNDMTYRGIFILNVKTLEEAQKLLLTDPAIREKVFETETYIWYGSAALPLYMKYHSQIEKTSI
ncbi:MAG: hypothetical protein HC905_05775 [Bacteroidales bacterium]|nr:hypothetical protein [Bacteroidales bacterium]